MNSLDRKLAIAQKSVVMENALKLIVMMAIIKMVTDVMQIVKFKKDITVKEDHLLKLAHVFHIDLNDLMLVILVLYISSEE